jgi:hypothetical protein
MRINANAIEYCEPKFAETDGIAVWGISPVNYYWLLKSIPALNFDSVKFINSGELVIPPDPYSFSIKNDCLEHEFDEENEYTHRPIKKLNGKEVFAPSHESLAGVTTVIVPGVPGALEEIKKQCAEQFPHIKCIVHITELLG